MHTVLSSILANWWSCSGCLPQVKHVCSVQSWQLRHFAYQIVLHPRCSCIFWQTSCAIVLQYVGLHLPSHHIHDTISGYISTAGCVRALKTLWRIVAHLCVALYSSFPWFHLHYVQFTSSLGHQIFILTCCYYYTLCNKFRTPVASTREKKIRDRTSWLPLIFYNTLSILINVILFDFSLKNNHVGGEENNSGPVENGHVEEESDEEEGILHI